MDPKAYWVGFSMVKGIGAVRLKALLDYYGDLETAWKAPADALRAAGLPPRALEHLLKLRKDCSLDLILERLDRQGIQVLTWDDADYPRRLREIDQSPPVLYLRGAIREEDNWAVGVVGTRQ